MLRFLRFPVQRHQGPAGGAEDVPQQGRHREGVRQRQGPAELPPDARLVGGVARREAVRRVRGTDLPVVHQEDDAGQGIVHQVYPAGAA